MNNFLARALAGFAATLPMTVAMKLMHETIPKENQTPLPPKQITMNAAEALGGEKALDEERERVGATLTAHFAYRAAAGALYAPLASETGLPSAVKGVSFGLAVLAVSYLGLLPATGLLSPATEHPARRNILMIISHVVWGGVLGVAAHRLVAEEKVGER